MIRDGVSAIWVSFWFRILSFRPHNHPQRQLLADPVSCRAQHRSAVWVLFSSRHPDRGASYFTFVAISVARTHTAALQLAIRTRRSFAGEALRCVSGSPHLVCTNLAGSPADAKMAWLAFEAMAWITWRSRRS